MAFATEMTATERDQSPLQRELESLESALMRIDGAAEELNRRLDQLTVPRPMPGGTEGAKLSMQSSVIVTRVKGLREHADAIHNRLSTLRDSLEV